MNGFVNFANNIAWGLSGILPVLCYVAGGCILLASFWVLWHQGHPGNPWRFRPWIPWVGMGVAGILFSFDQFLTAGNHTLQTTNAVGVGALTTWTPVTVDPTGVLGATPGQTIINILGLFDYFFKSYGALIVFMAILAIKHVGEGHKRRTISMCVVQLLFGLVLMNMDVFAPELLSLFTTA